MTTPFAKSKENQVMLKKVYNRKLLFVEDDAEELEKLTPHFKNQGNLVVCAKTTEQARELLETEKFDAVILDLMLPDGDGSSLLTMDGLPPVIILSMLDHETVMLSGFRAGAADYVVKPCSPTLLEARISLRILKDKQSRITLSGITLDASERTVFYEGKPVALTSSEFNILHFLMANHDNFFNSEEIYSRVWEAPGLQTTTVRYHISNLRRKIKEITQKNLIITEFGKGYAFIGRP